MLHRAYMSDLTKHSNTPVLAYCRKLIEQEYPEDDKLEIYRKSDEILLLKINHIGQASRLTVDENDPSGLRFVKYTKPNFPGE